MSFQFVKLTDTGSAFGSYAVIFAGVGLGTARYRERITWPPVWEVLHDDYGNAQVFDCPIEAARAMLAAHDKEVCDV